MNSTVTEDSSSSSSWWDFDWVWTINIATDVPLYVWIGYIICAVTTIGSCVLTAYSVFNHLRYYTKPNIQRYIVRIIYMAPIYSVCSSLALAYWQYAKFFDLIRDCYEAYLLYSFFCLLLAYINEYEDEHPEDVEEYERKKKQMREKGQKDEDDDYFSSDEEEEEEIIAEQEREPFVKVVGGHKVYYGEARVVYVLKSKPKLSIGAGCHPIPTPCCDCIKFGTGRTFLRWIKRGILQFVFMKPALAVATLLLDHFGHLGEGEMSWANGYLYIVVLENLSVSIAVYMLIMFYQAVHKELAPFKPIAKFLTIKAIIVLAMWQAIGVAVAQYYHIFEYLPGVEPEQAATSIQDLLVSVEMFIISFAMLWIFTWEPFKTAQKAKALDTLKNLIHTVNQVDVLSETVKTFSFTDQKAKALEKAIQLTETDENDKQQQHENQNETTTDSDIESDDDERRNKHQRRSPNHRDDRDDINYRNPPTSSRYGTY